MKVVSDELYGMAVNIWTSPVSRTAMMAVV
jgi:hypothetical protein